MKFIWFLRTAVLQKQHVCECECVVVTVSCFLLKRFQEEEEREADKNQDWVYFWPQGGGKRERERERWRDSKVNEKQEAHSHKNKTRKRKRTIKKKGKLGKKKCKAMRKVWMCALTGQTAPSDSSRASEEMLWPLCLMQCYCIPIQVFSAACVIQFSRVGLYKNVQFLLSWS